MLTYLSRDFRTRVTSLFVVILSQMLIYYLAIPTKGFAMLFVPVPQNQFKFIGHFHEP